MFWTRLTNLLVDMQKDNLDSILSISQPQDSNTETVINFSVVEPEKFVTQRNKLHLDLQCYLTLHKPEDYLTKGTKLYLSEDGCSGFGVDPDGQLISVFSTERARGKTIVAESVARGAKHLSCLGEKLRLLYGEAGFKVVNQLPWDDKYAPEGWNKMRFGEPNCYDMTKHEERQAN